MVMRVGKPRSGQANGAADALGSNIHRRAGHAKAGAEAALADVQANAWEELERLPEP